MIPFNKPYYSGKECDYIRDAVARGKISGDGEFTRRCHQYFKDRFGFKQPLLTTSCTDALEMSAILSGINPGDEVIVPSYTFVSTANAFVLRGAKIIFADSEAEHPNLDISLVESLITVRTKVVVVVHYAGVACDMDPLLKLAERYGFLIVEDAAQAIDSFYKGKPLGSIGEFGAFSFHETKNIIAGEGGMLTVNHARFGARAEVIREKGTNRSSFFRGEVDKYGWVDIGSSFLPSELNAAYLFAQLEKLDEIQKMRKNIWSIYDQRLRPLENQVAIRAPVIPEYATNNAHMFYLVCESLQQRSNLIAGLKKAEILAVFHYQSLHRSQYFKDQHDGRDLPRADRYTDTLVRLPLYAELQSDQAEEICDVVRETLLG